MTYKGAIAAMKAGTAVRVKSQNSLGKIRSLSFMFGKDYATVFLPELRQVQVELSDLEPASARQKGGDA